MTRITRARIADHVLRAVLQRQSPAQHGFRFFRRRPTSRTFFRSLCRPAFSWTASTDPLPLSEV